MKKISQSRMFLLLLLPVTMLWSCQTKDYSALVNKDIEEFRAYFTERFPEVELDDFADGVYAIDDNAREQWLAMEDFPPYSIAVEEGQVLFENSFSNGKTYTDCFPEGGAVRHNYPYFDEQRNMVVTLEMAINECRSANGEPPLEYKKGDIAKISSYMAYISRGKPVEVKVSSQGAYEAYLKGKEFFYAKRGQLNMSCAGCHMRYSGRRLRSEVISPALGHPVHFPVFRLKWGEIGTLQRRYAGCNRNIGAKPLAIQGEEYRNLEFFQTVMSNGMHFNGPASRK